MRKNFYIGCSGWYYKGWKGNFYPKTLPERDFFSYYTTVFNTVEINSTFYRFPLPQTVEKWYQQTPSNFIITLKVYKYITHFKKKEDTEELMKRFYSFADILKEKMGCFLFQFPKSFVFNEENLKTVLFYLNKNYKNALEFRHPSWWNKEVTQALTQKNSIFCTVSGFPVPKEIMLTGKDIYIRFHGDPSYHNAYSNSDLAGWTEKINSLPIENIWAYFNNTSKGHAPSNALMFANLLGM